MKRDRLPLSRVLRSAAFALLALPLVAAADPVVLRNGSYLEGEASVRQGATLISNFYATWNDNTFLPGMGVGSFSDGLTLAAGGAVLTPTSHLTTNISPTTLSAVGGTAAAIQASPLLDPASRLSAFAISQLVIEFILEEVHTFTYTGHYIGSAENVLSDFGFSHSMGGTLYRVIEIAPNTTASIFYFNDSLFSTLLGEQFTTYSGTLEPGRYFLQARSSVRLDTANTSDSSGYDVNLVLAPVPEPATMLFVATGLIGVCGSARRARRLLRS